MDNNILATIELSLYNSVKELYLALQAVKKDKYLDNERIVITYTTSKQLSLITELLAVIDIPQYFVNLVQVDSVSPGIDFEFSKNFCIYPWINLEIRNTGDISPCCKFIHTNADQLNIDSTPIRDAYQSTLFKDLREEFRQGHRPTGCSDCWTQEASGERNSLRQRANWKYKEIYYMVDYTQDDISNLRTLDLKLGNTCNLSCRICNPVPSSKIASIELNAGRLTKDAFDKIRQQTKWSETDEFWEQFLPIADNLVHLDIFGGEPLLNKPHYKLLERLVELDVAKNISILYNSNGTVYSDAYLKLWKKFKKVKIGFSIDDINDRFEYQRNGAVWIDVVNNIKKYCQHKSDKFTIELFPTISIQNVYYLLELIEWANDVGFDTISYSFLTSPGHLSINHLTVEAKQLVLDKLTPLRSYHTMINSVVTLLDSTSADNSNREFIDFVKLYDQERNQNFSTHHTDIAKAMGYD